MWWKCTKSDWQVMQDYAFVTNCLPAITPSDFRMKHTKNFLQMLHPHISINDDDIKCMRLTISPIFFDKSSYKKKVDQYYAKSGFSLHHVLIATQTICVNCGFNSKPSPCDLHTILIYTSLGEEPSQGSVIPSRCTNTNCRHWSNYGWDVFTKSEGNHRIFKPLYDRHMMPY